MDMNELAARVEAAGADEQRELLLEAFIAVFGSPIRAWTCVVTGRVTDYEASAEFARFDAMLSAKAYESAALMLVPQNCLFTARTLWDRDKVAGFASISRYELGGPKDQLRRYWIDEWQANAPTPALAICAASLRAHAAQGTGDE
jgi:hypothetical protein